MPDGASVAVSGFRITGAVSFAPEVLAGLLPPLLALMIGLDGMGVNMPLAALAFFVGFVVKITLLGKA